MDIPLATEKVSEKILSVQRLQTDPVKKNPLVFKLLA